MKNASTISVPFLAVVAVCGGLSLGAFSRLAAAAPAETAASAAALCVIPAPLDEKAGSPKAKKRSAAELDKAAAAYQARNFSEAVLALQEAYKLDPQVEILFNLAQACRELGRLEEAMTLYTKTLSETKDDTTRADCERHIETIHNKLASQEDERAAKFLREKEYAMAVSAWESAYKQSQNSNYLFQIAQAQRLGGQVDNAVASYQRFLEKAPDSSFATEAKEHLGRLQAGKEDKRALALFEEKLYAPSIMVWEKAYQISAQPIFLFRIAESQRLSGDKTQALAGYDRFLKETPENELPELRAQAEEQRLAIKTGTTIGRSKPIYKRWWFWTLIGGAAAAAIVGGVVGGVVGRPTNPFAGIPEENQRVLSPQ